MIVDNYQDLLDEPDVLSAACKYIAYSRCGLYYDFGHTILKAGTRLYRVRKYREGVDFSNWSQWAPSPMRCENRCNHVGEKSLYLGSDKFVCMLETNIEPNSLCAVGTYVCREDIELGGFVYVMPGESKYKIMAGMLLNGLLIAPSRNETNRELFQYLDSLFPNIDIYDIRVSQSMLIPYKMAVVNKKYNYYRLTNSLCDVLKSHHPDGIRYSSCYLPVETVGIECSAYNVVLYGNGIRKIVFESHELVTNKGPTAKQILECFDWQKLSKIKMC